jgi:hypothetical protein
MSWRDRDWAKFRKDEFEAIYGRAGDGGYPTPTQRGAVPKGIAPGRRARRRRRGSSWFRALRLLAVAVVGTPSFSA